jgi:hypothetical protein
MKYFILGALLLSGISVWAQDIPEAQEPSKAPEFVFRIVEDFLKIPNGKILAEAVGVAINSKGQNFILDRGNHPLLEFDAEVAIMNSFSESSPRFRIPRCKKASRNRL